MTVISTIFTWLNDQLLKMVWLQNIINWLFETVFKIDSTTLFYKAGTFFVYDIIKIFILLSVLIFVSAYIQSFFSPERTRKILSKVRGPFANLLAALLGTVT